MSSNMAHIKRLRSRVIAFLIGVTVITIVYTGCLILAHGWHGHPNSLIDATVNLLFTILFKPAYYLGLLLPRIAEWQHGLGIVLITGALWGVVIVGLGLGITEAVRKKRKATQPCAPPNGGPATPVDNSGVTDGPPSVS
jgi:hypothetical protein